MTYSPALILHICSGTVGLLSGGVAVFLRKGSRRHRVAGNVFVVSMLSLSTTGAYLGFMRSEPGNVLAGVFTFYLVATGWATARRGERQTVMLDWAALLVIIAAVIGYMTFAMEAARSPSGAIGGIPAGMYFFMGCIASLAAVGDIRMLVNNGVSGTHRLVRHLWRMCFGLFIASGSVFFARPHLFPAFMRKTYMLFLLGILPLLLMIFWLIRVRFTKSKPISLPVQRGVYSVRA